jgi:flagellar basal body-associated protein FliL
MALLPGERKIKQVEERVNYVDRLLIEQNKELKEQKSITLFFIIIVAVTLVATLVGLGGLYISAFNTKNENKKGEEDNILDLTKKVDQLTTDLLILKVKNPYLK